MAWQQYPIIKDIPVNAVDASYVETNNSMEIKLHIHNSYQIIYICEGVVEFTINKKVYLVGANSIVFISHLELHELKVVQYPYKRYLIQIKPDYLLSVVAEPQLVSIFKNRPESFKHAITLEHKESIGIASFIRNMYEETVNMPDFSITAMGSYLQLLLIALYRSHKQSFPLAELNRSINLVIQVQRFIEEHILEQITLKAVSKKFYTDMCYLSHLFKKVSGFTFKEYIILQRISKSKDLLVYSNDSITQVAMNSGFGNVNHFIRIFKKQEGITPLQYRKKCR